MKPFKTIDEQYDILLSRGLNFSDVDKAKRYLLNNNYYNVINCYAKFFMNENDCFISGTNFDEITFLHFFDKELKSILFKYIIEAEKHLKSIIAYRFSETYKDDNYAYLTANSYNQENILEVTALISDISKIIKWQLRDRNTNPIKHYKSNHSGIPFWIVSNYMNFGQMVKFYEHLKTPLQNKIAKDFSKFLNENLDTQNVILNSSRLLSYLKNVVELRNVVAHNNRLLGFKCRENTVYLSELHGKYNLNSNDQRQDIFNIFIVMQCLLSKNQYAQLHNAVYKKIDRLNKDLKSIPSTDILNSLGFPISWIENGKLKQ